MQSSSITFRSFDGEFGRAASKAISIRQAGAESAQVQTNSHSVPRTSVNAPGASGKKNDNGSQNRTALPDYLKSEAEWIRTFGWWSK